MEEYTNNAIAETFVVVVTLETNSEQYGLLIYQWKRRRRRKESDSNSI